jgi:hypothetical protein
MGAELMLVESILTSPRLTKSRFILLFTNVDLFRSKIKTNCEPIQKLFPKYTGPEGNPDVALRFFADMFTAGTRECVVGYADSEDKDILEKLDSCATTALSSLQFGSCRQ